MAVRFESGIGLPLEALDAARIRDALGDPRRQSLRNLEILAEVDSTNSHLLALPPPPQGFADVCIAERQTAGRGRRGRRWIAPSGGSLALSLAWEFPVAFRVSPALTLAVGVAIIRALERAGARGMRLKWPNDVWFEDRKTGGVLVELRTATARAAHAVIGIGLNLALPAAARLEIEATGTRVAAIADAYERGAFPARNALAGILLDELLDMLVQFEQRGFAAFREEWLALDALRDRAAVVLSGNDEVSGTARGVDAEGALMLEGGKGMQRFVSGDISLRSALGDA